MKNLHFVCCKEIQISNNINTYRPNLSLYLSHPMEVLVSNVLIVTICSTVFVTVIVIMDLTVGDSVVSLACGVRMHVVGSGNESSCTDDEFKHVNIGDHVVSMKEGHIIMFVSGCDVTESECEKCAQK